MRQLSFLIPILALVGHLGSALVSASPSERALIRVAAAQADRISAQYGLSPVATMVDGAEQLVVAEGSGGMFFEQIAALLQGDPDIYGIERAVTARLPGLASVASSQPTRSDVLAELTRQGEASTPCWSLANVGSLWNGFVAQGMSSLIHLSAAQAESQGCGAGATVAIIDTAVDVDHPLLRDAVITGYDLRDGRPGVPVGKLDQSVMAILESANSNAVVMGLADVAMLERSMAPVVDPALAATLQGEDLPTFFGHGTMVAGLVRLVAPGARILPLQAFDDSGQAELLDIIRAVYFAVENGADVINMSFSLDTPSDELHRAIRYAHDHGVVCVAAAGNQAERDKVYPAAFSRAVGVAATDNADQLSDFSNYGSALVSLAAPGTGVISTYPAGLFAAGWGTSFSTPIVSGALALIHDASQAAKAHKQILVLSQGSVRLEGLESQIGSGRIDVLEVVRAAAP